MSKTEIYCLYDALIDPDKLLEHPKNRNKHGQDQIDRLATLYNYHGIRHPIVISKQTGFIVAGHGRRLAAIRAGIEKFPVVYQDFVTTEAEYAFIQSDNAIATWSELDLAGINHDLQDLGPDFDLKMLGLKNFNLDFEWKSDFDAIDKVTESLDGITAKITVECQQEVKDEIIEIIKGRLIDFEVVVK